MQVKEKRRLARFPHVAHHMQSFPFIVILFTLQNITKVVESTVRSVSYSGYKSLDLKKKTARPSKENQHTGQQKSFIVSSENKRRTSATEGSAQLDFMWSGE